MCMGLRDQSIPNVIGNVKCTIFVSGGNLTGSSFLITPSPRSRSFSTQVAAPADFSVQLQPYLDSRDEFPEPLVKSG